MLIEHRGLAPVVDPSAYVAPNAVLAGDVHVGPEARILFGVVLSAEDGRIDVGARSIVMDNAVVRGRDAHPVVIGDDVMIGPHSHVNGARIGDGAFVATGCSLFPGSRIGAGAEIRVGAVVHVNTTIEEDSVVPIGWVAVGDPATVMPTNRHEDIWEVQSRLDFPGTVWGIKRGTSARDRMTGQSAWYGAHREDRVL
jgi:carbonic anhydrase/acetyltransferase-like protein (isoleucine patch superfamily)